ncbi:type I-D CRISPR-associated protein Cas5/Csc1 [Thermoplasma sp. Kam2015]|uniref:type I-D CRISPR-associated protein Cas5/Csc1 n=1 Tax=Thermoplasma sp. Kam2015 TaxID=2094122 RepID=UPI001293D991|nr:type I-D CRISPR-associated protein Cas5/Csc1 [Thermoplasma sp. Kam2015]
MRVRGIKLTAIEPINYYYQPSGRGNRSSQFIGDIALKYAMLHQLGIDNIPFTNRFKPEYEELKRYNFWFSVAVPGFMAGLDEGNIELFKPLIRNTLQGIDYNGSNVHPAIKVGQVMYKNFYFQQPIKPGSKFYAIILDDGKWPLPQVLRVGTGKTGVLKIEEIEPEGIKIYINLYTLRNIISLDINKLQNIKMEFSEHVVLQYFIAGPINIEQFISLYLEALNGL